jgi:hypothetical protein
LKKEHIRLGLTTKRLRKRHFGEVDDSNSNATLARTDDEDIVAEIEEQQADDVADDTVDFQQVARSLIQAAKEDDAIQDEDYDDADEDLPEPATLANLPCRRLICYFGRQELIPLAKLFRYELNGSQPLPSGRSPNGLDLYWKGAVKNLDKEMELYDLVQSSGLTSNVSSGGGSGDR